MKTLQIGPLIEAYIFSSYSAEKSYPCVSESYMFFISFFSVVLSALDFGGTSEALLNFTLSMYLEYDFEQVNQLLCD